MVSLFVIFRVTFVRIPKAEEPVEEVVAVAGPVAEGAENL